MRNLWLLVGIYQARSLHKRPIAIVIPAAVFSLISNAFVPHIKGGIMLDGGATGKRWPATLSAMLIAAQGYDMSIRASCQASKRHFTYVVRVHEMGPDYRLRPHHICSYYQESMARHYADLGLAAYDLQREQRTWVLSAIRVDYVGVLPAWRSEVTVEFWTRAIRRIRLYSDFRVTSEAGQRVAQGTACWLIFDEATRRPVPLDLVASQIEVCQDAVFSNYRIPKIVVPEGETTFLEQAVLQDDTDFNHHLNNLRYLVLAFEALPSGFRRQNALKSLEVRFLGEAFLGDTLHSVAVRQGTSVWHRLMKDEDQTDICLVKSSWHPHQCSVR